MTDKENEMQTGRRGFISGIAACAAAGGLAGGCRSSGASRCAKTAGGGAWNAKGVPVAPAANAAPVKIEKLGTIDIYIVESNPVIFRGKPWLMQYIRHRAENRRYRHNHTGASYFRFLDLTDMKTVSKPFGRGLHLGNAFVKDDHIVVTAAEHWGKPRFYQLESDDMEHWTEPRVILEGEGWEGYNTTMCEGPDGKFLLSFELGKPKDIVGSAFTMFFAESRDFKSWTMLDGKKYAFGRNMYTGAPMVRYHAGWYYFFHLEKDRSAAPGPLAYRTRVARSRDLRKWEISPHIVMDFDADDKLIHPMANLTDDELVLVRDAVNVNASDLDMCEWGDGLIFSYSWGDQHGKEFHGLGRAPGSERAFCESFFPDRKGLPC